MNRQASVKIIEPETISDGQEVEISQSEKEALLYKYYPKQYKRQEEEKNIPQRPKKFDADADHVPSNREYYDSKYTSVDFGNGDSIDMKIEIKTDMNL